MYDRYLSLLGVTPGPPSLGQLRALVRAHLERIPFENVSKLYYLATLGLRGPPGLALYLDGIEHRRFGGTCYSNNPHFRDLLSRLGYDVTLCGADMSVPDVHTALLVHVEGREYLVDVGYGAPLFEPMPRDLGSDLAVSLGNERWVLEPKDGVGASTLHHHRDGVRVHGYRVKPGARRIEDFRAIIEGSYADEATFMRLLRLIRFHEGRSIAIANLTLIRSEGSRTEVTSMRDAGELAGVIEREFGIAPDVTGQALRALAPGSALRPE